MKILQCWDDGVVSDVRLVELLRRYGVKATFCLNPGLCQKERSFGWLHGDREVRRLGIHELERVYDGFEISNHSMTHPYLTGLSKSRLDWEIHAGRDLLEKIFKKPIRGFCYPFNTYDDFVLQAVRSAGCAWARGGRNGEGVFPPSDPLMFTPHCHFLDPEFDRKFDKAKGTDEVFFFWGHSYEFGSETLWKNFESWIQVISLDKSMEWSFIDDLFL